MGFKTKQALVLFPIFRKGLDHINTYNGDYFL